MIAAQPTFPAIIAHTSGLHNDRHVARNTSDTAYNRPGPYRAIRVGAQFSPVPAQAGAIVGGAVHQMPQVELSRSEAAFELDAALRVGVVKHQLVVAGSAKLLAAHAPLRRAVAVSGAVARCAMPEWAVAASDIALCRISVIMRSFKWRRIAFRAPAPARCRRHAAFTLPVVKGAHDNRPVDVIFKKLHQHFLSDARQELAAHAAAGRTLRHGHPAAGLAGLLPMKANAHAAKPIAIEFIGAVGLVVMPHTVLRLAPPCLVSLLIDDACWGCGMTRAALALVRGDLAAAWEFNKLSVLVMPMLLALYTQQLCSLSRKNLSHHRHT